MSWFRSLGFEVTAASLDKAISSRNRTGKLCKQMFIIAAKREADHQTVYMMPVMVLVGWSRVGQTLGRPNQSRALGPRL